MSRSQLVLAQLSDLHCGSPFFDGELPAHATITQEGYAEKLTTAQRHLEPLFEQGLAVLVIPGNHDSESGGYLHFRDPLAVADEVLA